MIALFLILRARKVGQIASEINVVAVVAVGFPVYAAAGEMAEQQAALDELRRKMHDKNEADSRLAGRYGGDRKFMRVHKRLAGDFASPSGLHDLLISVKTQADGKIMTNYALLDNPAFFEHDLWRDLKQGMTDLSMTPDLALIKRMGALIAQEYIEERNN